MKDPVLEEFKSCIQQLTTLAETALTELRKQKSEKLASQKRELEAMKAEIAELRVWKQEREIAQALQEQRMFRGTFGKNGLIQTKESHPVAAVKRESPIGIPGALSSGRQFSDDDLKPRDPDPTGWIV
jgi:hypothetical protein